MKSKHSLEFNVNDLKKARVFEYQTEIDREWFLDCETDFYKIISANTYLKFEAKSTTLLFFAKLLLKVKHTCSRCGDEFDEDVCEEIFEEYEEKNIIDVFPLIRETAILNQPIRILCLKCREKQ